MLVRCRQFTDCLETLVSEEHKILGQNLVLVWVATKNKRAVAQQDLFCAVIIYDAINPRLLFPHCAHERLEPATVAIGGCADVVLRVSEHEHPCLRKDTSARECDGERKLGMYSFRTIEGATAERRGDEDTSAYSVPVGRSAE
jgi:hypothetical protein